MAQANLQVRAMISNLVDHSEIFDRGFDRRGEPHRRASAAHSGHSMAAVRVLWRTGLNMPPTAGRGPGDLDALMLTVGSWLAVIGVRDAAWCAAGGGVDGG